MRPIAAACLLLALVALAGCSAAPGSPDDPLDGDGADPPSDEALSFTEVAADAGFDYSSTESGAGNGNDGIYVTDYDDDLREDLLVLGDDADGPALFRNTGEGYERTGELPDVDGRVQSALWFDYDADGDEDLLLLRRYGTAVFLENENGSLERTDVGLEDEEFSNPVGATAADADGDGRLEVFVIQSGDWSKEFPTAWHGPVVREDNGNENRLYSWDDDAGEFVHDESSGVGPGDVGEHWSLATSFEDLTGDGHPDIHVANDFYNDTLYVNQGDGTFEREYLGAETDRNGMSSATVDFDADGRPSIFVTNIHFSREAIDQLSEEELQTFRRFTTARLGKRMHGNNLLSPTDETTDGVTYVDRGEAVGVADGGWGWAATVADLDSDGERDLAHATQIEQRFDREHPIYAAPMVWVQQDGEFYRQDGIAIGLEDHNGRGLVQLDHDLDGALDVAVATYDDRYRLYRNDADQGQSLQVVIDGPGDGTHTAVGAVLEATVDDETQRHVRSSRADYQSQDTRVTHVGLGDAETVDELRVEWPDGTERTFEDVEGGQRIRVTPDGIEDQLPYDGA